MLTTRPPKALIQGLRRQKDFANLATYCVKSHNIVVRLSEIERFVCTNRNEFVLPVHSGALDSGS